MCHIISNQHCPRLLPDWPLGYKYPRILPKFIEKMEEKNLSVRSLAQKASVSPTVIQKLRNNDSAEKITYSTFLSVIKSLGYRMKLEKI